MTCSPFSLLVDQLCAEQHETLDGILILYNDSITVIKKGMQIGKRFDPLSSERYHLWKNLAHTIVYYSIKHEKKYSTMTDLCNELQDNYRNKETEPYFSYSVPKLMTLAAEDYLTALDHTVQDIKNEIFECVWPTTLLIIICGPASPRYGHPAMQYFARLANCPLEMRCQQNVESSSCYYATKDVSIDYVPKDATIHPGRTLFYVENPHTFEEAKRIGLSLYVEKTIFSRFRSMNTDILAPMVAESLREKCGK